MNLVVLALCIVGTLSSGLKDNPIVGDTLTYLESPEQSWTAKSDDGHNIAGNVPGDLITDLYKAGVIGDPIYETVWLDNSQIWDKHVWTYTTTFSYSYEANVEEVLLVFDGIKMGANIYLNNQQIGVVADQFLRYSFPVKKFLHPSGQSNSLNVTFPLTTSIDCEGRFMACTGGWDWAPYSNTRDQHGASTLTKGIWKSVYLTSVSSAALTHVVPLITYTGSYPTSPLNDTNHSGFLVTTNVHIWAPTATTGSVLVSGSWGQSGSTSVSLNSGDNVVTVKLNANNVNLWWPAGLGVQNLYTLNIQFTATNGDKISTTRKVGFRTFALVTADDSDPSKIQNNDGSGSLTMRFRVNGANIWSRGGNMIPMEEYEGRANADAFSYLLKSAVDGNMNTLRIWGGGIFLYDVFYDTADELGLIMYHDMMYAQQGHSPSVTPMQTQELQHQVRRLSSHPSIVIWDACNECGGQGIYASFVSTTVAKEDPSRPIWPSCPSAGWTSGVSQLWGTPNGKPLFPRNSGSPFETHGPYQHGSGWPAVNGDSKMELFSPNVPPSLPSPSSTGPTFNGVYASEFGCVGWSSFESMTPTVSPNDWSLHSKPMYQRNYPCDNIIQVYWGAQSYPVGSDAFKKQLYQCLVGQNLELKSDIEVRRARNEWGTVIWQLNEVWPTGGWGTVEYGTPVKGQSLGGRWKPVHYSLKNSVYTDVTATCGTSGQCYIKNDGINSFTGTVTVGLVHFKNGVVTPLTNSPISLANGGGVIHWFCAQTKNGNCSSWAQIYSDTGCSSSDCILSVKVTDSKQKVVSNNVVALNTPQSMNLPSAKVSILPVRDGNAGAHVLITSDNVAAYVILTTEASGRFSDNAMLVYPGTTRIEFIPYGNFGNEQWNTFSTTLRVEHAKQYQ